MRWNVWFAVGVLEACLTVGAASEDFSIASFNVNNYRLEKTERRSRQSDAARAAVARTIRLARPDIVGLQELGSRVALETLRGELFRTGLEYPYSAILEVSAQEIHCGVLSRYPIVSDRSNAVVGFPLYGRSFTMLRGVQEVEVEIRTGYRVTVINVHLKSQLPSWYADESDFRLAEARVLRKRIDERLIRDPSMNLVVLGDLNDRPGSRVLKCILGKGKRRLSDCRPSETWTSEFGRRESKGITWTHHFEARDSYFRYDYLLVSPGMRGEWRQAKTYIPTVPDWYVASDHRLIMASFFQEDL